MPGKKPYPFGSPRTIKRALARAREQLELHKKKRKHNHTKKLNNAIPHGPSVWNNSNSNSNNNSKSKRRKHHN
jgi:hypothetical protein